MDLPASKASSVFQNRNFLLLWVGQGLSMLGDQFYLIAAPWLVLRLTNDPLALGTVLAASGIPRALFMLVGGAVTDRISQRTIMLISDSVRLALTALMAVLTFTGTMQLWMLYVISFLFGTISGFFSPASSSMLPTLVKKEHLSAGNSLTQATSQIVGFVGPVLAGGLIALFGVKTGAEQSANLTGIAVAFGVDAITFLVSIFSLLLMQLSAEEAPKENQSVWTLIQEGIQYVLQNPVLRLVYIVIFLTNFLVAGPLVVGIPVMADQRLAEGAVAYGLILSAYAGGNLGGILLAGVLPKFKPSVNKVIFVGDIIAFGAGLVAFAGIYSTWVAFAIMIVLGLGNGYISIALISYLQKKTPREMLGRIMSLLMFANYGLMPIAQAIAGVVIKIDLSVLFLGAGVLLLASSVWIIFQPALNMIAEEMTAG